MLDLLPGLDHGLAYEETQLLEVFREVGESSASVNKESYLHQLEILIKEGIVKFDNDKNLHVLYAFFKELYPSQAVNDQKQDDDEDDDDDDDQDDFGGDGNGHEAEDVEAAGGDGGEDDEVDKSGGGAGGGRGEDDAVDKAGGGGEGKDDEVGSGGGWGDYNDVDEAIHDKDDEVGDGGQLPHLDNVVDDVAGSILGDKADAADSASVVGDKPSDGTFDISFGLLDDDFFVDPKFLETIKQLEKSSCKVEFPSIYSPDPRLPSFSFSPDFSSPPYEMRDISETNECGW